METQVDPLTNVIPPGAQPPSDAPSGSASDYPRFRFHEYNAARKARGAEAVRLEVRHAANHTELLWMSRRDLVMNIEEFGEDPALRHGLECYAQNTGQQKGDTERRVDCGSAPDKLTKVDRVDLKRSDAIEVSAVRQNVHPQT